MLRRHQIALVLGLAAFATAGAAPVPFLARMPIAALDGATDLAVGDVDADGDLDLVAVGSPADAVIWIESTGTSSVAHGVATGLKGASAVTLADVDGDGSLDVVVAAAASGTMRWYANVFGDGSVWLLGATFAGAADGVSDVAAGDFDGDGDLDLVGSLPAVGLVRWWQQAAGGGFLAHTISSDALGVSRIAVADFDGDGALDVAALVPGLARLSWWANPGNSRGPWSRTDVGTLVQPTGLHAADLDGDGDADLLAGEAAMPVLGWWSNAGGGTSWVYEELAPLAPTSLATADVDGDGDLDVVAGSPGGALVWLERSDGGAAWRPHDVPGESDLGLASIPDEVFGDGFESGDTSAWSSTVGLNRRPVAVAGADQTVTAGMTVELDGAGSLDPDGATLQFAWSLTGQPAGSTADLSNAAAVDPVFVADLPGVYVVELVVDDGVLASAPDEVTVSAEAPVLSVTATDAAAAEAGADPGAFAVARTGDTAFPLLVSYTLDGSAENGVDTVPIPTSLTIPIGETTATLDVIPIDDGEIEGPETVTLTLVAEPHYAVGLPASATVTIADDDKPVVTIVATDDVAGELGPDPGTFTLSRTGLLSDPLEIFHSISGSAENGVDYETIASSATIPAGVASTTITITPIADAEVEGPENVLLGIEANATYVVGTPALASLTIKDAVTVTIEATDADASELNLDPGALTLTRGGGDLSSELQVLVSRGGTASGADYDAIGGPFFLVTIPVGMTSATVTITPLRDNLVEGPETAVLTVESGGLAYVPGSPDSATVTIADDPPVVGIVATDPGAAEAGVDPGGFTLIRNGGNLDASLVTSFTIGGSAANNSDYAFISVSLTIPAGSASATVTITPLADNLAEGDETVTLTIEPRTSYIIDPTSSAATVTIVDDPPVVTVTATDADAAEAGLDPGAIVVARSGGNLAASLNAFVQRSGTATSGLDFVSIGGGTILVTIPGGANDATLAITPHDDLLVEGPETVILTLQPSSSYTIGSPGAATVTIADDD